MAVTPTGNVTVSDGSVSCLGTVAAGGCSLASTTSGSKTLTATYAGERNFTGSTSAGAGHTVDRGGHDDGSRTHTAGSLGRGPVGRGELQVTSHRRDADRQRDRE